MARPYRFQGENCFYHITSRGDGRKSIFISDYDHHKFLRYLLNAKIKYNFYLYAYVLMNNHYHLLIETSQPNLSKIMHYINSAYTTYYNIKRHKYGHLFQGRYKSILVDKDSYLLELTRYIHLNPVRANIVAKPEDFKYSSYQCYIKKADDGYIDEKQIREVISIAPDHYRQYVEEGIGKKGTPLKDVYAGFILGKPSFIKEKLKILKEKVESKDFSYKDELRGPAAEVKDIMELIGKKYGINMSEPHKMKKHRIKEKKIAIYLIKRYSNLNNDDLGKIFGISYSAASKAARSVEKQMQEDSPLRREIEKLNSHFKD
jgi:putative transposase